jgi:hypothetical protein
MIILSFDGVELLMDTQLSLSACPTVAWTGALVQMLIAVEFVYPV